MDSAATLMHVERAQGGDADSMERLLRWLAPDAAHHTARYYGDFDQEQVVRLAFAEAIRSFDPASGAGLRGWAGVVATRRLITALQESRRLKHAILNTAAELDAPAFDEDAKTLGESGIMADRRDLDGLERRAEIEALAHELRPRLTPLERGVFDDVVAHPDDSYGERAARLGISEKSLDNAFLRLRGKARQVAGELGAGL